MVWLTELERCDSTNTWALDHLSELRHGDVVFTQNQTAGRGQFDRSWVSSSSVLTASFVLELSIEQLSGFSLIAGLSVIYAIEMLLPDQRGKLRLKWTNDIFANGRKLSGVLCESRIRANQAQIVVGIGMNCEAVPDRVNHAISLQEISAHVPERAALLEQLRLCLMQLCDRTVSELLPEIRSRDLLRGQCIQFDTGTEQFTGEGAGIDEEGQLLIQVGNEIRAYRSGRVLAIQH
ncbi:biotin--[acetyl-CoA-carboxylase] ligase [Pseudanabaenaceae cyanobacterium LEGE 13415]|nr:biotin--[acetyl-CoA-carboxylase] ligase [Pseudanabaenaceae cyanobacterium LEGE 13415]